MKSWFQNCSADLEAMLCSEAASKLGLVLKLQCLVADKTLLFCQNESKVMYLINRLTGLRHPCAATIAGSATKVCHRTGCCQTWQPFSGCSSQALLA